MPRKKKLVNHLIDDTILSGPEPDEELLSIGNSMKWLPVDYVEIKPEEDSEIDLILSIL